MQKHKQNKPKVLHYHMRIISSDLTSELLFAILNQLGYPLGDIHWNELTYHVMGQIHAKE